MQLFVCSDWHIGNKRNLDLFGWDENEIIDILTR
jgi:hypothetical protein